MIDGRFVVDGSINGVSVQDDGLSNEFVLEVTATGLWWSSAGTAYDVMTGSINELRAAGDLSSPMSSIGCLSDSQVQTGIDIYGTPDPGNTAWYLIRPQPGGTYDSGGSGQTVPRDLPIDLSGNDCPAW